MRLIIKMNFHLQILYNDKIYDMKIHHSNLYIKLDINDSYYINRLIETNNIYCLKLLYTQIKNISLLSATSSTFFLWKLTLNPILTGFDGSNINLSIRSFLSLVKLVK